MVRQQYIRYDERYVTIVLPSVVKANQQIHVYLGFTSSGRWLRGERLGSGC